MSPQTKLEIKGNLSEHRFAELLIETTEANLSGSFRLTKDDQKIVIYLNSGKVVFAVSNLRQHRLFSMALSENKVTNEQLLTVPNAANDMELSAHLVAQNIISPPDVGKLVSRQIEEIIKFCLVWDSGEWTFSSLARIKEDIRFEVDLQKLLLDFSRDISPEDIANRFKSNQESFGIKPDSSFDLTLQSHEAFVLSRFEKSFLTIDEIDDVSGLPENVTRQVLYGLWLGGFLYRQNWDCALSETKISEILSAKLRLVMESQIENPETPVSTPTELPSVTGKETKSAKPEKPAVETEVVDEGKLLQEYLERVENAANLYETIGVTLEAETPEIKKAYFAQAKKYHPDLFHKNEEFHRRIQTAFTNLAHAYETLKIDSSRDLYNYKMRKELAELKEREKSGISADESNLSKQAEQAAENFEWGLNLLQENEFEEAVPFFARAVHFDEKNARYHAYYGKSLSFDKKNLHKAEAELQTAIKFEPQNVNFRLMLAELFVHIGLKKRAEGELNRLLAIAPEDRDALALLDRLQKK